MRDERWGRSSNLKAARGAVNDSDWPRDARCHCHGRAAICPVAAIPAARAWEGRSARSWARGICGRSRNVRPWVEDPHKAEVPGHSREL